MHAHALHAVVSSWHLAVDMQAWRSLWWMQTIVQVTIYSLITLV